MSFSREREYAIVKTSCTLLRKEAGSSPDSNHSTVEDELFSGWAVCCDSDSSREGWTHVTTFYGYSGYVRTADLKPVPEGFLKNRRWMRIRAAAADVLSVPKVQGLPLAFLLRGSFAEVLETDDNREWSRIRTADGTEGYIHTAALAPRRDHDGFLFAEGKRAENYFCDGYYADLETYSDRKEHVWEDEEACRKMLVETAASYLRSPYRWGGKSPCGIDCSGLVFMSYLACGIVIHRDASIKEMFPVRPIERKDLKKGDLIFFPGHVAMYLGDQKYIHATAFRLTPEVTVNSFAKEDPLYRGDLDGRITGCGRVFFLK